MNHYYYLRSHEAYIKNDTHYTYLYNRKSLRGWTMYSGSNMLVSFPLHHPVPDTLLVALELPL